MPSEHDNDRGDKMSAAGVEVHTDCGGKVKVSLKMRIARCHKVASELMHIGRSDGYCLAKGLFACSQNSDIRQQ